MRLTYCGTPSYTYVYDRFGNRWQQNGAYSFQATFTGNSPAGPANNNRIDSYTYDAAGNLTHDASHFYYYDAENRLIQIDGTLGSCSTATACYTYDAFGRRVHKAASTTECTSTPSPYTDYIFDLSGRPFMVTSNGVNQCHDEIYAGSRHLATYSSGAKFVHADWLGTERVRSWYGGTGPGELCTSLPFGDGLNCGAISDPGPTASPLHFTGKQRDAESNLDYFGARYDSSSMGRFMSPDPENIDAILHDHDPQSWNGYAYARNNPLLYTDPDGLNHLVCENDGKNCADLTNEQYNQFRKDNPNLRVTPSGDIYTINENGTETKTGHESYYNEHALDSLVIAGRTAQIGVNYAMLVTAPNYLVVGGAHFFLGGSTITTLGITPRFVPLVATSPALMKMINWIYQEGDELWDGTAGALRAERLSGEAVGGVFHSQKAADIISNLDKLLKSNTLSAHDQAVAKAIIQKLSDAAAGR